MSTETVIPETYVAQHDRILDTMKGYFDGLRAGKSSLMRPSFHAAATFFGHHPGGVMAVPIQQLFDWIDGNGASASVQWRIANVEILYKIAYVHVEVEGLSGALAGTGVRMSDIFTLMMDGDRWTIIQKAFHWHT